MKNKKLTALINAMKKADSSFSFHSISNLSDAITAKIYGGIAPIDTGCSNSSCYNPLCSKLSALNNKTCNNNGCNTDGMNNDACTNTGCVNGASRNTSRH